MEHQGILVTSFEDIEYFKSSKLTLRNLTDEAKKTIKTINNITNMIVEQNRKADKEAKKQLKNIQTNLRAEQDFFVEEFIKLDGIAKLISLIKVLDSNLVKICLESLTYVLVYLNGIQYLRKRPHLFVKMLEIA